MNLNKLPKFNEPKKIRKNEYLIFQTDCSSSTSSIEYNVDEQDNDTKYDHLKTLAEKLEELSVVSEPVHLLPTNDVNP